MKNYELLLLDAANTIIHKPDLWKRIIDVLNKHNIIVDEKNLKVNHKLLSEIIHFPDRTDSDFYKNFNKELLLSLGIIPTNKILEDIFDACTYLPWERFEDTHILEKLDIKKAVLSNFKNTLSSELEMHFGNIFDFIVTSESKGIGKPHLEFYKTVLEETNIEPEKILYIGDSLKLDIIPGTQLGFKTLLIDREDIFKNCENKIYSLDQLKEYIN